MATRYRGRLALFMVVATAIALAAFQLSAAGSSAQASPTVSVRQKDPFGSYLADAGGKTLYTLSSDPAGQSTCTGNCTMAWPPLLLASGNPTAPAGLTGSLGVITRSDNGRQVTYNNQAVYTFARDTNASDTNGEGVNAFGGTWHVAKVAAAGAATPAAVGGAAAPGVSGPPPRATTPPGVSGPPPTTRALPPSGTGGLIDKGSNRTGLIAALALAALASSGFALILFRRSPGSDRR